MCGTQERVAVPTQQASDQAVTVAHAHVHFAERQG